jgi:hypothetical protein
LTGGIAKIGPIRSNVVQSNVLRAIMNDERGFDEKATEIGFDIFLKILDWETPSEIKRNMSGRCLIPDQNGGH